MADNLNVTAGTGSTIGMDEVVDGTLGTVKVGFGKIMDGTLDSTNKLIVNSSGEALVKPTANSQVDVNKLAGTTIDVNSGVKSAGTQRVVLATDQPQLTNALKVDGSAVTQPVSGTVTANIGSVGTLATAAKQPALGTAGTASADVITVQGKAAMTPVLIDGTATTQPVSLATNTPTVTNLPTTVDTNSGSKSASTLRVVLATDQPVLTNKLLVTPDSVALPANQSVNISQINGVTTSTGAGASGTGTQRVVIANDAGKTIVSKGGSASSSGNNTLVTAGTNRLKVHAFSLTTTSTTAMTCIFQDGASGTELWRVIIQAVTGASTGANLSIQPPGWLFATSAATLLNLNLSSANAVHWSVSYTDEA